MQRTFSVVAMGPEKEHSSVCFLEELLRRCSLHRLFIKTEQRSKLKVNIDSLQLLEAKGKAPVEATFHVPNMLNPHEAHVSALAETPKYRTRATGSEHGLLAWESSSTNESRGGAWRPHKHKDPTRPWFVEAPCLGAFEPECMIHLLRCFSGVVEIPQTQGSYFSAFCHHLEVDCPA